MMLPNAHLATVDQRKITDYLLNAAHPDNGGKARFFEAAGFTADNWTALSEALCELAARETVLASIATAHGTKYVIAGMLQAPSGEVGPVRCVWIMDRGRSAPRLVTAYPCA